jgi:hypothetical protein
MGIAIVTQHPEPQHTIIRVSFTVRVDGPEGPQRRKFLIIPRTQKQYTSKELRDLDEALKDAVRDCLS